MRVRVTSGSLFDARGHRPVPSPTFAWTGHAPVAADRLVESGVGRTGSSGDGDPVHRRVTVEGNLDLGLPTQTADRERVGGAGHLSVSDRLDHVFEQLPRPVVNHVQK
ncbi:hypothetical protein Strop_1615 [Salinispora tropica CNB-440]|uniref:Uncharacterized protein n=1 Tax=Salinispora tropica (strain ATCC BAA-916 / DSM 44818 / JCM 13857 / NBRC 105044 / CNB-440) TaxID=369723 RepID=A4X5D0_SALTO|nr:hypothetical protein Strop_1615 [Salinispora tropica CNB-440]